MTLHVSYIVLSDKMKKKRQYQGTKKVDVFHKFFALTYTIISIHSLSYKFLKADMKIT